MGLSIRRGTTKSFDLFIPPFCKEPDGVVELYTELPELTIEDKGQVYKVLEPYQEYHDRSYFKWSGTSWEYIGHDKSWGDLGSIHIKFTQDKGATVNKYYESVAGEVLTLKLTQEETLKFQTGRAVKMQVFYVKGPEETEDANKSNVYSLSVQESLWDEAVHNE